MTWKLTLTGMAPAFGISKSLLLLPLLLAAMIGLGFVIDLFVPFSYLSEYFVITAVMGMCSVLVWALLLAFFSATHTSLSAAVVVVIYLISMLAWSITG